MAKPLTDLTTTSRRDWRFVFLEMLAKSACVSTACISAKVSRQKAYWHREKFPRFREKWDEALEIAVELLEVEARGRALAGKEDPASATLLQFLLKSHKPEKYNSQAVKTIPDGPQKTVIEVTYKRADPVDPTA